MTDTLVGSAEHWGQGWRAQAEGSSQAAQGPKGRACPPQDPFLYRFLIISPFLPSFYTEAVASKRLRGPQPGSILWPQTFEVETLPSTYRKVKAKGKFKARLCDKPKAEAYPVKRLSLPMSLPLTNTLQKLKGRGVMRLGKSCSVPQCLCLGSGTK